MDWVLYKENEYVHTHDVEPRIRFIIETTFDMQFWDDVMELPVDYESRLKELKTALSDYNINMINADYLSISKDIERQFRVNHICDFQKNL